MVLVFLQVCLGLMLTYPNSPSRQRSRIPWRWPEPSFLTRFLSIKATCMTQRQVKGLISALLIETSAARDQTKPEPVDP